MRARKLADLQNKVAHCYLNIPPVLLLTKKRRRNEVDGTIHPFSIPFGTPNDCIHFQRREDGTSCRIKRGKSIVLRGCPAGHYGLETIYYAALVKGDKAKEEEGSTSFIEMSLLPRQIEKSGAGRICKRFPGHYSFLPKRVL